MFTSALIGLLFLCQTAEVRPNILWLSSEDNGPHLGCYGDDYAQTPNLDALAARGLRYQRAWSNAPVCSVARTTLITGRYANSMGAHHHRSRLQSPAGLQFFPQALREAGYYCTNNSKEDYNLAKPDAVWHESSRKAHWRNRKTEQPFFAVFNVTTSHESRIRKRPHELRHDPAQAPLPSYHPDRPEVRHDWAQYYDQMTVMDARMGVLLGQLQQDGLAEDTIVFYFGDHGSGMPRHKRWTGDSGQRVPLIVHIPDKFAHLRPEDYQAGGLSQRLVSFVDFAPTVFSLLGIDGSQQGELAPGQKSPAFLEHQGKAFLGPQAKAPAKYLYAFRGRMDERNDMVRGITDGRFVYLNNYVPGKAHGQHVSYMFETPTTALWHELFLQGELSEVQARFWQPRPREELYDLQRDPDEVNNLVGQKALQPRLERLRYALREHLIQINDLGFLPEAEMLTRIESGQNIPVAQLIHAAEAAGKPSTTLKDLLSACGDQDSGIRWWALQGLALRSAEDLRKHLPMLTSLQQDDCADVQILVAEILIRHGFENVTLPALEHLCELADPNQSSFFVALSAWQTLDDLEHLAAPVKARLAKIDVNNADLPRQFRFYLPRVQEHTLRGLN